MGRHDAKLLERKSREMSKKIIEESRTFDGRFSYWLLKVLLELYLIFWLKRKYFTIFILANIWLAVFIAIDYRRFEWRDLVIGTLVFEICLIIVLAIVRYVVRKRKADYNK